MQELREAVWLLATAAARVSYTPMSIFRLPGRYRV